MEHPLPTDDPSSTSDLCARGSEQTVLARGGGASRGHGRLGKKNVRALALPSYFTTEGSSSSPHLCPKDVEGADGGAPDAAADLEEVPRADGHGDPLARLEEAQLLDHAARAQSDRGPGRRGDDTRRRVDDAAHAQGHRPRHLAGLAKRHRPRHLAGQSARRLHFLCKHGRFAQQATRYGMSRCHGEAATSTRSRNTGP
jgi:hypothetical protein